MNDKDKEILFQLLSDGKVDEAGELVKNIDKELLSQEIQDIFLDVSFSKQSCGS